jgi:hypothetical protein
MPTVEEKHKIEKNRPFTAEEKQKLHEVAVDYAVKILKAGNRGAGQPVRNAEAQQALIEEKELEVLTNELKMLQSLISTLETLAATFKVTAGLIALGGGLIIGTYIKQLLNL